LTAKPAASVGKISKIFKGFTVSGDKKSPEKGFGCNQLFPGLTVFSFI
jgi:hypothetical protein